VQCLQQGAKRNFDYGKSGKWSHRLSLLTSLSSRDSK